MRKALYSFNVDRASLIEIYAVLFVLILDLTVQTIKSAVELLLPETKVPGMRYCGLYETEIA